MFRIMCLFLGYFIGCLQSAYFVGRIMGKIDIREHGSGNAGTTNITRVIGAKAGLIVFISDIFKGIVGFLVCSLIFSGSSSFFHGELILLPGLYGSMGVILGHNFPFYLKFKGGKGVAASLGVILCIDFRIAIIAYIFGILCVYFTHYISVASLIITISLPILLFLFKYNKEAVILGIALASMAWFQHRHNIVRLFQGAENKFTINKDKKRG